MMRITKLITLLILSLNVSFASWPIGNNNIYVKNNTNFPITVKYVKCTETKMADIPNPFVCEKKENTVELAENSSVSIGSYVEKISYKRDGVFFALTSISNNVTTKQYSTDFSSTSEVHCAGFKNIIMLLEDYKSNQLFCNQIKFSGVRK